MQAKQNKEIIHYVPLEGRCSAISRSHGLDLASNKEQWLTYLPNWWGGGENQKKKAKLVCLDKDSLTEQQRKSTVTTTLIRRIYKTREYPGHFSHHSMPSVLPSNN